MGSPILSEVDGLALPSLTDSQMMDLEILFSEEEVYNALCQCYGDKTPGPDSMTMTFIQDNWDTLKVDILRTLTEFHSTGKFAKSLNATFIGLIPKKSGAREIRDYRPMSLVGCVYKLLYKVLVAGLRGVIGSLISDNHNAFVGVRQILNAVLIVNELVDSRIKEGRPGVICKLDIEKVYDHMNWEFLIYILKRMDFENKWIRWIQWCTLLLPWRCLVMVLLQTYFLRLDGFIKVGEDLSDGEARVLAEFGWIPNTGLGTMLNYCDRVVHDRKQEKDSSEWRSKIAKHLINGYNGGNIVSKGLPKNLLKCQGSLSENIQVKLEQ